MQHDVNGQSEAKPTARCPYTATKTTLARWFGLSGGSVRGGAPAAGHGAHPAHGAHAGHAQGEAHGASGAGFHERLKARTWPLHERAERHTFQQALMRGELPLAAYVAQLEQTLLVHRVLEGHLRGVRGRVPAVDTLLRDYHFREGHALRDLHELGGSDNPPALEATGALIARIEQSAALRPHALAGFLYVLEGSTNGAKFIGRALAKAYGLESGRGLSYQDPHGDALAQRWREFKQGLNALALTPEQEEDVIVAAEALFAWNIAMFEELQARHAAGALPG